MATESSASENSGFRGFTAPASLKHATAVELRETLHRFRGFTAPASLKLVRDGSDRVVVNGFPGLYRPGLIEA